MKAEAKANEAADKAAREKIEKLNQADSLAFQAEKQLKEFGDKIPAEKKQAIEGALSALKYAHDHQEIAGVDRAMTDLNTALSAASEDIYKTAQQAAGRGEAKTDSGTAGEENQQGGKPDDVTDVPFEEVK